MKALSIQQPWVWAILHAGKRVENRTWGHAYRGPLALHASKGKERLGDFGPGEPPESQLVFGAILGVADIVKCVKLDKLERLNPEQVAWLKAHPFASGPYCWILKNVRALPEPIFCNGARGLWDVSEEVVERIAIMLER